MPPTPPHRRLEDAGFDLQRLTAEQREVLASLSPEELEVLVSLKLELDEAGPEVEAHEDAGGIFW